MRRSIIALALAGLLAGGCYTEVAYPPLVYAGLTTSGDPMYYGDGHYWVNAHGAWYWWNSYDRSWKYAPYGYYHHDPYAYGYYYGPPGHIHYH